MSIDLNDNATHEEIQSFVDQIVADRGGEAEGDAAKIAKDNDIPVTERDDAAGKTPNVPADWRADEDFRAMIAAYGMEEKEFADFSNREEAERALRLLDKRAHKEGLEMAKARDEKGRFVKTEDGEPGSEKEPVSDGYRPNLDTEVFHKDLVEEFRKLSDYYEDRFSKLESRFAEADARAQEEQCDQWIDSLGCPEIFGVTGEESEQELNSRRDVIAFSVAMKNSLAQMGKPVQLDQSLIARAARMAFPEEMAKKEWKAKTRKVLRGGVSRIGGESLRSVEPGESIEEWAKREYSRLESL